ncbi:NmrA/HSCARG family protein [Streptomyces sp. RKAG293]|uniref:NmrA/HSCARG family protein n=1 Tax=Streptomyces sp. RKAG293 TaxID=2893403 RepID=UPI0020331FCE|nr:NmrA/HSCARG family protein [Streptomyces sp. RKAG293]MCM2423748.1 NmrA/HSCARG family protein [Streptomyces sp. RKAG293]
MADSRVVLVTGGTGRQGGATARALLARGWQVNALVRDPGKAEALALREHGAVLVRGDLDDPASLDAAVRDVYGVYSVQTFTGPDGMTGEVRQGKALAKAAARAGVAHFVYSSVDGSDRPGKVTHFASKGEVERYIEELGLPATVLRPTFFITNFEGLGPQWVDGELVLTLPLDPRTKLQMITPDDIGAIAVDAFDAPADHLGRSIPIAGDELTGPQMAGVFARVAGRPVRFARRPIEEVRVHSEEMAAMFSWFDTVGFQADLPALRAGHPNLTTLADWANKHWTAPAEQSRIS